MCHINAFRFFEGVPKLVKIDNLSKRLKTVGKAQIHPTTNLPILSS
jgi:transposase